MALADIKPYSAWSLPELLASLGYTQSGDDNGNTIYRDSEGSRLRFDDNGDPILNGGNIQQGYNTSLQQAGYDRYDPYQFGLWANKLGMSQQDALNYIYGDGSQIINDPTHGSLIQSTRPYQNWTMPDLTDYGFMNTYGPATLLLPAVGGIAGAGAGAAAEGGAGWTSGYDLAGGGGFGLDPATYTMSAAPEAADGITTSVTNMTDAPTGWTSGYDLPSMESAAGGSPMSFNVGPGQSAYSMFSGATAASPLARLLSGAASTSDYAKLLGTLGAAGIGAYGANQSASAYRDLSDKYFGMGAPYRDLLLKSYSSDFKPGDMPGFNDALDASAQAVLRKLSTTGNPFDNPGGVMEANKYVTSNVALPAIQNYRSGLSAAGQLGTGPAAQLGSNSIQSQGGVYDSLGYGLGQITNPTSSVDELLKKVGTYSLNRSGLGV